MFSVDHVAEQEGRPRAAVAKADNSIQALPTTRQCEPARQ